MQKRFGAEKVFFRLDITDLTDECSGQWEINAPINVNPVGGGGGGVRARGGHLMPETIPLSGF